AARRLELRAVAREARLDQRNDLEDLCDGPAGSDVPARERHRYVDLTQTEPVRDVRVERQHDLGLERRLAEVDLGGLLLARRADRERRVRLAHAQLERRVGAL